MTFDRAGFDREVGLRMQVGRKAQKMTQEEMAKRIGVTRPSYASVESGRQRIPIDVVWRVAVVLGVSIASLVPQPLAARKARAVVSVLHPRRRMSNAALPPSDGVIGFSSATNLASMHGTGFTLDDAG